MVGVSSCSPGRVPKPQAGCVSSLLSPWFNQESFFLPVSVCSLGEELQNLPVSGRCLGIRWQSSR